jgi:hypothetical protein
MDFSTSCVIHGCACQTSDVSFFLGFVALVVFGLLAWLAFRIEPHWCSKDGRRMIARAQRLPEPQSSLTSWSEVRVFIDDDEVILRTRGLRAVGLRGEYRVIGKSPSPPKNREIYLLRGEKEVFLRIPTDSRGIATLEELLERNR